MKAEPILHSNLGQQIFTLVFYSKTTSSTLSAEGTD